MHKNKVILALIFALTLSKAAFALTSGPAMPEYNDFESVDNTDLVNLATGDFTYTIPVMTVPGPGLGFPIVLNYHGGIQPEQEASWVGLGWNLQAGAITRRVNNFPDDFKGVLIEEKFEGQHIYGWMASFSWNGVTVGISWDSEVGYGGMVGYSFSVGGEKSPLGVNVTAGTNGVYEGLGVSLSVSGGRELTKGLNVGASASIGIHSERGMTAGVGYGISASQEKGEHIHTSASLASIGVSLSSKRGASAGASLGVGVSATTSTKGQVYQSQSSVWIPFWTPWTGYMELNAGNYDVYVDGLQEDRYYGFLYSDDAGSGCNPNEPLTCYKNAGETYGDRCKACGSTTTRAKKLDYINSGAFMATPGANPKWFKVGSTGEDLYSVQTQGISGTFKPYRTQDGDYYSYISNQDYTVQQYCQGFFGDWFGSNCDRRSTYNFGQAYETNRDHHTSATQEKMVWRFNEEVGGGLYTNPLNREGEPLVTVASKRIESIFNGSGGIIGWVLTAANGVRYLYTLPQYNYIEKTITGADADLSPSTRRETPAFAYAWLLTAILSPDYVEIGTNDRDCVAGKDMLGADINVCLPRGETNGMPGDIGGWVRFDYAAQGIVGWKAPLKGSEPNGYNMGSLQPEGYSASMGIKSVAYLSSITTPTHEAVFTNAEHSRSDNLPQPVYDMGIQADFEVNAPTAEKETCDKEYPREFQKYAHKILINKGNLPPQTDVSVVVSRQRTWSKYTCELGFFRLQCGEYCRDGIRDEILKSVNLADLPIVGENYVLNVPSSTKIEHVRVVIGKTSDLLESATSLGYLRSITLKNKVFGKEVSSVRFAYDYSLGQGSPNSESAIEEEEQGGNKGRLTLLGLQIGASSNGPWNPPYRFEYGGKEILYDRNKHDYWGDYCATCGEKKRQPDGSANIWNLKKVTGPSGSEMEILYEPKQFEYVEGMPVIFKGSDLGKYFAINRATYKIPVDDPYNGTPPNQPGFPVIPDDYTRDEANPDMIPGEIADLFGEQGVYKDKFIAFRGSFEIPYPQIPVDDYGRDQAIPVDLSTLQIPGASHYIVETPKIYIEDFVPPPLNKELAMMIDNIMSHGLWNDPALLYGEPSDIDGNLVKSMIKSDRMKCIDPSTQAERTDIRNCRLYSGRTLNSLNGVKLNFANFSVSSAFDNLGRANQPGVGMRFGHDTRYKHFNKRGNQTRVRVWAVFDQIPSDFPKYGGGVRVSQVKYREPFSAKENTVDYTYGAGATPTLPDPISNYSAGIKLAAAQGMKAYVGNPGVLHGSVTAKFGTGAGAYSTAYNFVTSKDLPVRFVSTAIPNVAIPKVETRMKILDRSGLWGSLWRKDELNSAGVVVRTDLSHWANRIDSEWKSKLFMDGIDMDISMNGEVVLKGNDPDIRVSPSDPALNPVFGVTQKLWGSRFISRNCEELIGTTKDNCIVAAGGVNTTQVEILRFAPLTRDQVFIQDGLAKTTEENLFDFRTGTPLVSIQSNVKPDGGTEYFASMKELAYRQSGQVYQGMLSKNMLEQEFSTTAFRFDAHPSPDDFLSPAALSPYVVTSQFTTWRDYSPLQTRPQYRMNETFKLKDRRGFGLPTPSSVTDPDWQTQGRNSSYDVFGHVTEFENPASKQRNAQLYAYGKTLPVAFAMNARMGEVFHQSFETQEYVQALHGGVGKATDSRSRTGSKSFKVMNCLETIGGILVPKAECGNTNSTMVCFDLPGLPDNNTYVASAWYYDDFKGSNPDVPMDPAYIDKTTQVTRPGIFIGKETGTGCQVENHPNGANASPGLPVPPVGNDDPRANQRAMGGKNWKRIWSEFTPAQGCGTNGVLANAILCLYASKWKPGSDVIYDEVRIRPKSSLMSTYTYDHRGKMTSTADANEITSHFEYDAFGTMKGIRNDDGVLLSEQARKYHGNFIGPSFRDREPTSYPEKKCAAPEFPENGDGAPINYTLISSSDLRVAGFDATGKLVCTYDFSGPSDITINLPDLGKTVVVPIRVKGSQVAAMTFRCNETGLKGTVDGSLNASEAQARANLLAHCQFDYTTLKNKAIERVGAPTGYGVTVELKRLMVDPFTYEPVTGRWNCVDGVITPMGECNLSLGHHAHLQFSRFKSGNGAIGQERSALPNAFPNAETENRFKGVIRNGTMDYLIITNNASRPYSPYAPVMFKRPGGDNPPTEPVAPGRYFLDPGYARGGGGYLKMEFGMLPGASNQFDFEAQAFSTTVLSFSHKTLVDNGATPDYKISTDRIAVTVRAYVKQ